MTRIVEASSPAGDAERLAGAGAGPDRSIVRPSRETQGEGPDADPREEMALHIADQILGSNVSNVPPVDDARGNVTRADKVLEPVRSVIVILIIVCPADHLLFYPLQHSFKSRNELSALG